MTVISGRGEEEVSNLVFYTQSAMTVISERGGEEESGRNVMELEE